MSKSLKRMRAVLEQAGLQGSIIETGPAKTAVQAAAAVGCAVDQIAKFIIFQGIDSGQLYLFITAGAQNVDPSRAMQLTGETLQKANAAIIRNIA